jgi:hypothetical protein
MTYGLDAGMFVEDGPAVLAAKASTARPSTRFIPWRRLDFEHRLAAVEGAMKVPANDLIDGFPLAL